MDLINPLASDYVEKYSDATPSFLRAMFEDTQASHPHAHLQSSWNQGGFLTMMSKIMAPSSILEIGTFTGFSSLCLAEGLSQKGILHTIELREKEGLIAASYFQNHHKNNQIKIHIGDAKLIIPTIDLSWDLVFIDADKTGYIEYYELVLPRLNQNGLIIVDNVLFHGDVLSTPINGKNAKAIQAFNEHVFNDSRTEKTIVSLRDGLTLIRKK